MEEDKKDGKGKYISITQTNFLLHNMGHLPKKNILSCVMYKETKHTQTNHIHKWILDSSVFFFFFFFFLIGITQRDRTYRIQYLLHSKYLCNAFFSQKKYLCKSVVINILSIFVMYLYLYFFINLNYPPLIYTHFCF